MIDARSNGDSRESRLAAIEEGIDELVGRVTFIDLEIRKNAQIFHFGFLFELNIDEMRLRSIRLPVRV